MSILLGTLLIGWVTSQQVVDPEPQCRDILFSSSSAWFLSDLYFQTFGNLHNLTKLYELDIRNTNVFTEIQSMQWSQWILQNWIYSLLQMTFGSYLEDIVDGSERVWNEENFDYDIPEMKPGRKGTIEEMVRFEAKHYEEILTMSDDDIVEFKTWANDSLKRISNKNLKNGMSNKEIALYMNELLEKVLNPESPGNWLYKRAVSYTDWTGKMEDRLRDYLKDKVFFQKPDDNPLNGGHDILTFLAINPKVLKSPKVNPLLRMSLAKDIVDFQDFDKYLFQFLDCFAAEFGDSFLIHMLGMDKKRLMQKIEGLKTNYEENSSRLGMTDNTFYWVDLANAIFDEFETLDLDNHYYKLYIFALKTRSYLLKLDIEKNIYPQYQEIQVLVRKAYFMLLQKPETLLLAFKIAQTEKFWELGHDVSEQVFAILHNLLNYPQFRIWKSWRQFPAFEDLLILVGNPDERYFKATQLFRDFGKMDQKSMFEFDSDSKTSISVLVNFINRTGFDSFNFLERSIHNLIWGTAYYDEFRTNFDWVEYTALKMKIAGYLKNICTEICTNLACHC